MSACHGLTRFLKREVVAMMSLTLVLFLPWLARGVSQHYGKNGRALNNITLVIPARSMVGLVIGQTGWVKSSLLSLISGARID